MPDAESGSQTAPVPPVDVSVVVPVYNAARTLPACVDAVLLQEYAGRFESVFVDNGSTDGSLELLRSYEPRILVCEESRRGPSAARNRGAREAHFELLAFTDADCVPTPHWLSSLVRAHSESPGATLVGGPILAWRAERFAARFAERLFDQERAINAKRLPYVISANLCVYRSLLSEAGMFDETLMTGEDVDLSYRMQAMGPGRFVFAEDAIVEHANPDSLGAIVRKGIQHGRTVGRLADRHSDIRGETAMARLLRGQRYVRIASRLATLPLAAWRRLSGADERAEGEWLEGLYDAAFDGAKQLGVAAHVIETRIGSSDRAPRT